MQANKHGFVLFPGHPRRPWKQTVPTRMQNSRSQEYQIPDGNTGSFGPTAFSLTNARCTSGVPNPTLLDQSSVALARLNIERKMKCCAVAYFALSPHPAAMTNNDPIAPSPVQSLFQQILLDCGDAGTA